MQTYNEFWKSPINLLGRCFNGVDAFFLQISAVLRSIDYKQSWHNLIKLPYYLDLFHFKDLKTKKKMRKDIREKCLNKKCLICCKIINFLDRRTYKDNSYAKDLRIWIFSNKKIYFQGRHNSNLLKKKFSTSRWEQFWLHCLLSPWHSPLDMLIVRQFEFFFFSLVLIYLRFFCFFFLKNSEAIRRVDFQAPQDLQELCREIPSFP